MGLGLGLGLEIGPAELTHLSARRERRVSRLRQLPPYRGFEAVAAVTCERDGASKTDEDEEGGLLRFHSAVIGDYWWREEGRGIMARWGVPC
mgnify:CR=1 FL=1